MSTSVLNRPFRGFYQTTTQGKSTFAKKQNRINFDQPVPSAEKTQINVNSDYLLDALSQIISNQTLSPEQLAESQSRVIDEKIDSLKGKYEISGFDEIKAFLSKNRFLISLLEEIPGKIYQYFGSSQKLALQVVHEPDFPEDSELWILVLTELPAKEARSLMNRFDKDWWLKNLHKAGCKLNVGIEYV